MKLPSPVRFPLASALGLAFSLFVVSATQAQVLYRQTFGSTENNVSVNTVGWTVATGTSGTDYTTSFTTSPGVGGWITHSTGNPTNLPNVNTGTPSSSQSLGIAIVSLSSNDIRNGLIYTNQFSLNPSTYTEGLTFSWTQGNSNVNALYQVALQINGSWYASTQTFKNTTAVSSASNFATQAESGSFTFNTQAASWMNLNFTLGSTLNLGSVLAADLPAGAITGFGLYMTSPAAVTARFDTFTITAVPEPATATLILLGTATSLLIRRRRKS